MFLVTARFLARQKGRPASYASQPSFSFDSLLCPFIVSRNLLDINASRLWVSSSPSKPTNPQHWISLIDPHHQYTSRLTRRLLDSLHHINKSMEMTSPLHQVLPQVGGRRLSSLTWLPIPMWNPRHTSMYFVNQPALCLIEHGTVSRIVDFLEIGAADHEIQIQ